jgi:hypothetical protein
MADGYTLPSLTNMAAASTGNLPPTSKYQDARAITNRSSKTINFHLPSRGTFPAIRLGIAQLTYIAPETNRLDSAHGPRYNQLLRRLAPLPRRSLLGPIRVPWIIPYTVRPAPPFSPQRVLLYRSRQIPPPPPPPRLERLRCRLDRGGRGNTHISKLVHG